MAMRAQGTSCFPQEPPQRQNVLPLMATHTMACLSQRYCRTFTCTFVRFKFDVGDVVQTDTDRVLCVPRTCRISRTGTFWRYNGEPKPPLGTWHSATRRYPNRRKKELTQSEESPTIAMFQMFVSCWTHGKPVTNRSVHISPIHLLCNS